MDKQKLHDLLLQYLNTGLSESDCMELLDHIYKTNTDEVADAVIVDLINLERSPELEQNQAREILLRIESDLRLKGGSR